MRSCIVVCALLILLAGLSYGQTVGPGLVNIDMSLAKAFAITEGKSLQFRAEVFNGPNHPNFAVPSLRTAFTSASGVPSPTAGVISATVTRPRQIQFGLKLTY